MAEHATLQRLTILGATGSIGVSALDVIADHPERFSIYALTANTGVNKLFEQIRSFKPSIAVLRDEPAAQRLRALILDWNAAARDKTTVIRTEIQHGDVAIEAVSRAAEVDTVVAAIVGSAGLLPTMAAVRAGKRVLLANKESLVMAGGLFMSAVAESQAELLPVDSEHNAIFQCLPSGYKSLKQAGVEKILLTGSGGPFLDEPLERLTQIAPEQAIAHPNWSMGPKISVDSATMMNKGLEFIEACWLFGARPDQIEIVIHPQSIIHSMVSFIDGSVVAQMGQPDMRTPIAHCLGWPERLANKVPGLSFSQLGSLDFRAPDFERFPCLSLAIAAMRQGGVAPAVLNAANEIAVGAFLGRKLSFLDIATVVDKVMQQTDYSEPNDLNAVVEADRQARALASLHVERDNAGRQSSQLG